MNERLVKLQATRAKGCPVDDCESDRQATLVLQLRPRSGPTVSRTVNLCENHALDLLDHCGIDVERVRDGLDPNDLDVLWHTA